MKVKDLIEELKKFPEEYEVLHRWRIPKHYNDYVADFDYDEDSVDDIESDKWERVVLS